MIGNKHWFYIYEVVFDGLFRRKENVKWSGIGVDYMGQTKLIHRGPVMLSSGKVINVKHAHVC